MSKKYKKVCRVMNYIDHSVIVISIINGCISISDFASLVGISIEITSQAIELKTCVVTARMKKYKSIIKKKNSLMKILLLAKSKLNRIEILIYKALIDQSQ